MNEELPPSGLTRRSFIKRSVVASVAVSSMTIFSGLVNASTAHPSTALPECKNTATQATNTIQFFERPDGTVFQLNVQIKHCSRDGNIPCDLAEKTAKCGEKYKLKGSGPHFEADAAGTPVTEDAFVECHGGDVRCKA